MERLQHRYMIDNVVMLIEGTRNKEKTARLLEKINPLGRFEGITDIVYFEGDNFADLYHIVLVDSPVGSYFQQFLEDMLLAMNKQRTIEDIEKYFRNISPEELRIKLNKLWLEEMYGICQTYGGCTSEIMVDLLKFEADCTTIHIIYHSLDNPELNT